MTIMRIQGVILFILTVQTLVFGQPIWASTCTSLLARLPLVQATDRRLIFHDRCAGLCGISSVTNAVQLALNDLGRELIADPYSAINAINMTHPETRGENGVPLPAVDGMLGIVSNGFEKLTGLKVGHQIFALPIPWKEPSPTIRYTSDLTTHSFISPPGERQVLMFAAFSKVDERFIGMHAVTLVQFEAQSGVAIVSDPNMPNTPISFRVRKVKLSDNEGQSFELIPLSKEFFVLYSNDLAQGTLILHSIATITVRN